MIKLTAFPPLVTSVIALAANAASAAEGLPPSSSWNVDYAETECRLSRTFGAGKESFTFRIPHGANFKTVESAIASKSLKYHSSNFKLFLCFFPPLPRQLHRLVEC